MKACFTLLVVLMGFGAFAQREEDTKDTLSNGNYVTVTITNVDGYINGTRIDLVDAIYARFIVRANGEVIFDYGQSSARFRNDVLTNKKGMPLVFLNTRIPFLLNFFHYNHWELAATPSTSAQPDWLLKRQ